MTLVKTSKHVLWVSERRLKSLRKNGIKFLMLQTTYVRQSSSKQTFQIMPLGRIQISRNHRPYIYCKSSLSTNMTILTEDAKNKKPIGCLIDIGKLFTENEEILRQIVKLRHLKQRYKNELQNMFMLIKEDIMNHNKKTSGTCFYCGQTTESGDICKKCETTLKNTNEKTLQKFFITSLSERKLLQKISRIIAQHPDRVMDNHREHLHKAEDYANLKRLHGFGLVDINSKIFPSELTLSPEGKNVCSLIQKLNGNLPKPKLIEIKAV